MSVESNNLPVPTVKPAAASRKPKAAPPAQVAPAAKKPFRMSYDGTTTNDHIQYMIDHGAR